MECFSYRKLRVYQQVKNFVICVYELLKCFPKEENYALCDQLRRSAMSIPSNIAEGMGRCSIKEQVHFIEIAFGSFYWSSTEKSTFLFNGSKALACRTGAFRVIDSYSKKEEWVVRPIAKF